MISTKQVPPNVPLSIRDNLDSDLHVTDESDLHTKKQHSTKIATEGGIIIDLRLFLLEHS
jgi:hypothetical protein